MFNFVEAATIFWRHHPGLLYGLAFLLGCAFSINFKFIYFLPCVLIWGPLYCYKNHSKSCLTRYILAFCILLTSYFYTSYVVHLPNNLNSKEISGIAYFEIASFNTVSKHYGSVWQYSGNVRSFASKDTIIARNIPVTIQLSKSSIPPPADRSYRIEGELREVALHRYIFVPSKDRPWVSISNSFSLAKWRFHAKEWAASYIKGHISDPHVAAFLVGIVTGNFQDRLLSYEFSRFSLQHIMAISGFHFAIAASFMSFLLSLILPRRFTTVLLIIILTLYFLFLGNSPSVMRAWISATLLLCGILVERKSKGLNSLGIALMVILTFDPLACTSIGFQFSFAATAAILCIAPPLEAVLQGILPKRPLSVAVKMNSLNQHGYTFLSYVRQAVSLSIAVNCVALPLTFFHFTKFPLMGLFYNLFFPFMVSISMIMLLLGSTFEVIFPPLGRSIHAFNGLYTHFMLGYTYNLPSSIDYVVRFTSFSLENVIVALSFVFIGGLLYYGYRDKKREEIDDWAFI